VIDLKLKREVFKCEKFLIQWVRPLFACGRDIFLPSVYDGLVVIRPQCNFRDGTVVTNAMLAFGRYLDRLPFHDSYFFGLLHLVSARYLSTYQDICKQVLDIDRRDVILGFAAVFLLVKSYASCLVAELSQVCYGGVLRAIALASTDGLCTFSCGFVISLQPVSVPVGRIALGRILNVVGSSIDPYLDLALSTQFQTSSNTLTSDSQADWFSSCRASSYPLAYPNHLVLSPSSLSSAYAFNQISLCLGTAVDQDVAWCFYIACLYASLLELDNWTPSVSAILASRVEFVHLCVVRSELIQSLASIFYSTDGFYSSIKPIHQIHRAHRASYVYYSAMCFVCCNPVVFCISVWLP